MSTRESLISEINTRYDTITEQLEEILKFVEDKVYDREFIADRIRELIDDLV